MGGKSFRKESFGAEAAGHLLFFDPDKLVIVTDKAHPLYDERVNLPLDEAMVLNIMVHGVCEPIIVRLNGEENGVPLVEVVDGRQRVFCAREANKRLKKEGKEAIRVPATYKRADAGALMGVMISTNEHRRDDGPMVRAQKLQRYMAMGKTEEEAAITFGVTRTTISNMLKLLELHPKVQDAVEKGVVPATIAKELHTLPQEKQPEALQKMIESGATKGARGTEAAKNVRKNGNASSDKVRMRSRKQLESWRDNLKTTDGKPAEIALAVVSYVLGNDRALSNFPQLREAFKGE